MKLADVPQRYEDELLFCCARVSQEPGVRSRMEQLVQEPLDWQAVLERSWWHRIRPLTYYHLRSQPAGTVPDDFMTELAEYVRELSERNQRLSRALSDVTAMFDEQSLRMLVYKGPTLTMDAYGDLNLRECGDLDLLVHRDEFSRAIDLLQSNGFAVFRTFSQSGECELQGNGIALDVHWDLAPWWLKYRVDFDRLWEDGLPLAAHSGFARKLRPEDAIVVLSIHGTKHWWERLRWICDIAELVNRGRVKDWDRLAREAAYARSSRSVSLGLWLACDLLSAKLPSDIRRTLDRSTAITRMGTQVSEWLRHCEPVDEWRSSRERLLFRMRANDRARDCLPQMARTLVARLSRRIHGNR